VLSFWRAAGAKKWFAKDAAFDDEIRARFLLTYEAAVRGELSEWETTPDGALALTIVLDQFPRNMFRHDARAFAADAAVRGVVEHAIARGFDQRVARDERSFLYLPFEHSENLADQERGCMLVRALGDADLLRWAELHADIIRRFGRFPHRNAILGRESTPAEQAFLEGGGFAG